MGMFFVVLQLGLIAAWLATSEGGFTLASLRALAGSTPPTGLILATLAVQFAGMLGLATGVLGVAQLVRRWWTGRTRRPWRSGFALRGAVPLAWAASVGGGVAVGWFPGFLASRLREWFPAFDLGALGLVDGVLADGSAAHVLVMALLIVVVAPVVEELVFRGVLWHALERWLPAPVVLTATTVLFAAFHLDPMQAVPLLFTGAFLGWVRWTTGSVGPAMAVHVVNNGLALLLGALGVGSATGFLVASSVVVTAAMAWVLWNTRVDLPTPAVA